ncbi:uncharacterized protein A4U43_C09F5450 [Asparagus officinalis]|uniref:Pentatricopeptide repeat-containing protein n=1 Tax=Asparagus officinalis TaxID=4686 RepID=A0A5P1E5J3_ASPOF|nr:uncharacterized protein A4U43_C09F5450 [Asparagus officinalis]
MPKAKWNANFTLIITHPILSKLESSCNSMAHLHQIQAQMTITGLINDQFPFSRLLAFSALSATGDFSYARRLFAHFPNPNTHMFNTMIRGFNNSNFPQLGLSLFSRMILESIEMDKRTFVFTLKACEMTNWAKMLGEQVYSVIFKVGFDSDLLVQNGLMHLYVHCCELVFARKTFDEMSERDVVSWTTIIDGYSQSGSPNEAVKMFYLMRFANVRPNEVTMVSVISTCSQLGVLKLGKSIHECLEKYGVNVSVNVMNALVDMMHGNLELGKCAGDKLLGLDPGDSGTYALMSIIYATRNRWDDVKRVRMLMRDRGIRKTPGCSSIEVEGKFHEFFAADQAHLLYLTRSNGWIFLSDVVKDDALVEAGTEC